MTVKRVRLYGENKRYSMNCMVKKDDPESIRFVNYYNGIEPLYGFCKPNWEFICFSNANAWDKALTSSNWKNEVIKRDCNPIPMGDTIIISESRGVEFRVFTHGHKKFGTVKICCFKPHKDNALKRKYFKNATKSEFDEYLIKTEFVPNIEEFLRNKNKAIETALTYRIHGKFKVDMVGVDEVGNLIAYHKTCTQEDCVCHGGNWEFLGGKKEFKMIFPC